MSYLVKVAIGNLKPEIENPLIVGIIIGKSSFRKFNTVIQSERGVVRFTLRDSPEHTINVHCWGSCQYIETISNSFHVGDIVKIYRPRIKAREFGSSEDMYSPQVTSPFSLIFNENKSDIQFYEGDNKYVFTELLTIPSKKVTGILTLYDIEHYCNNTKNQYIDVLVGVRTIGPIKPLKCKDNVTREVREIIVMDQTTSGKTVMLWDLEDVKRSAQWQPKKCVLFIADAQITFRQNRPNLTFTSKTLITVNPKISATNEMLEYMSKVEPAPLLTPSYTSISEQVPDVSSIRNIISISNLNTKIDHLTENRNVDFQFAAKVYCFITDFKLDNAIITKCGLCKRKVNTQLNICFNLDCPAGSGSELVGPVEQFDVRVNLTDHTDEIQYVHIEHDVFKALSGCTVENFKMLSEEQLIKLKWKYLLERWEIKLYLKRNMLIDRIEAFILQCKPIHDNEELAQKLPVN